MRKEVFKYSKDDILNSKTLDLNKDVLFVILEDDKEYSIDDVKKLVDEFYKKEVE